MCDCDCELKKQAKWQQVREETALQLGRDAMEMGLRPFLTRLVGTDNTTRLLAGICWCPCDACVEYCEQLPEPAEPCCQQPDACCGCSCPPQEDDDLTRPVAADCGVHGDDGCIASGLAGPPCDGVERDPSTCRCPCYGCKHHCGAHEEPGLCTRPGHACRQPGAGPCNGLPRDDVIPALLSPGSVSCTKCGWGMSGYGEREMAERFAAHLLVSGHGKTTEEEKDDDRHGVLAAVKRRWWRLWNDGYWF